jgi:hypothetical protein
MLRRRNSAWQRPALESVCAGLVCAGVACCCTLFSSLLFGSPGIGSPEPGSPRFASAKPQPPAVRWNEQHPGCTFSRGDDGKYRYGLWSGDVGIILAVDAREVQIIQHRIEPIFGVLLTIRYRGSGGLDASPEGATLQFMKHFKVVEPALDPDDYAEKIQADADALDDETRRAVAKHPEEKQVRDARLQEYQKSIDELIEFLGTKSLHAAHLDPAAPEVSGWVFFNTKSKWLGGWKAQEEFILRLPLDGKIFEFPFKLPPEKGELLLQKRP